MEPPDELRSGAKGDAGIDSMALPHRQVGGGRGSTDKEIKTR
jgi:hypothetical protein